MRLMRWADPLHQYNFNVVYRPGKENDVANMLSRSMQRSSTASSEQNDSAAEQQIISKKFGCAALQAITEEYLPREPKQDQTLDTVCQCISTGWPKQRPTEPELHSFYKVQNELTAGSGCV